MQSASGKTDAADEDLRRVSSAFLAITEVARILKRAVENRQNFALDISAGFRDRAADGSRNGTAQ